MGDSENYRPKSFFVFPRLLRGNPPSLMEDPNMSDPKNPTGTAHNPKASGMRKGLTNYGDAGFSLFLRKAFIKGAGYTDAALDRPVIGVIDTGSGYNPCHGNMPQLVEAVNRGVMLAGGLPVKFPTFSIG